MQDFEQITRKVKSVSSLLIETPGAKTIKENRDHFIKRETVKKVCLCCAATALFTLQTNGPQGGAGHRTSIREGGPITTLLVDDQETLWKTVALNTLPENLFMNNVRGNTKLISDADIFPWMGKTRVSDAASGQDTTPSDTNPKQVFWGMPRRIRLNTSDTVPTNCDLCNDVSNIIVESYVTKAYGVHYLGTWNHPLTPHRKDKEANLFPIHTAPRGISYRDWLGFVMNDDGGGYEAAYRINQFRESGLCEIFQPRLWAFGFDMDQMKAKCWYEGIMPLIMVPLAFKEKYDLDTLGLIKASEEVGNNLRYSIKKSWFNEPDHVKSDLGMIDRLFWTTTESKFYEALIRLKESLENKTGTEEVRRDWHKTICNEALRIFNEIVLSSLIESENPKRIVTARNELIRFNRGKKIIETTLELPNN